jgi:hypothetical protein
MQKDLKHPVLLASSSIIASCTSQYSMTFPSLSLKMSPTAVPRVTGTLYSAHVQDHVVSVLKYLLYITVHIRIFFSQKCYEVL